MARHLRASLSTATTVARTRLVAVALGHTELDPNKEQMERSIMSRVYSPGLLEAKMKIPESHGVTTLQVCRQRVQRLYSLRQRLRSNQLGSVAGTELGTVAERSRISRLAVTSAEHHRRLRSACSGQRQVALA
jgi:hypothetical protein